MCSSAPESIFSEQRLSESFEVFEPKPDLEVVVHVYDLNMTAEEIDFFLNHNQVPLRMQDFNNSLLWYALFVNCVEYYYRKIGIGHEDEKVHVLTTLTKLFQERGMFVEFFNRKDVIDVTLTEFSREKDLIYGSLAKGREEGIIGAIGILAKLGADKDSSIDLIMNQYDLSLSDAKYYIDQFYPN
jgi:hypothetical protein